MAYISPMLTNIVTAVKKASINLNRDFSEIERLQNSVKGSMDFTKIAFDKIQKGLKNELGKILPALPVVMVSEKVPQSGMFLILSGIEGLANFAHGNPEFAISAALMDCFGRRGLQSGTRRIVFCRERQGGVQGRLPQPRALACGCTSGA